MGWLAASATLAKRKTDDAPQLICVPEIPFSLPRFLSDLDGVVSRVGWAVVVVSEGIAYADGTPVFEQKLDSAPTQMSRQTGRPLIGGVAQYLSGVVAQQLGIRCRSEKPGLIGRSCTALISSQDRRDAALAGREGVRALVSGATDRMAALRALRHSFGAAVELIPLSEAAGPARRIPSDWLTEDGSAVAGDFAEYARPIAGELSFYDWIL